MGNKIPFHKFNIKKSKSKTFKDMCLLCDSLIPEGVSDGRLNEELVSCPTFSKAFLKYATTSDFPYASEEGGSRFLGCINKAILLPLQRSLSKTHTRTSWNINKKVKEEQEYDSKGKNASLFCLVFKNIPTKIGSKLKRHIILKTPYPSPLYSTDSNRKWYYTYGKAWGRGYKMLK